MTIYLQVEIGGIRGKVLTQAVQKIHETFREIYAVFGNRCFCKSMIEKKIVTLQYCTL